MKAIKDSLLYAFHVITHPFDGFWCAQRERRGDVRAATILIALVTLVSVLQSSDRVHFQREQRKNPRICWPKFSVSWCQSFSGAWPIGASPPCWTAKGASAIFISPTAYALTPIILVQIPMILLSQIIVLEEARIYQALGLLMLAWVAFLLFSGLMTIHQYTVGKTLLTVLIAIVGMAAILFLFLLFFALIQQLMNFLYIFYKEMTLRV